MIPKKASLQQLGPRVPLPDDRSQAVQPWHSWLKVHKAAALSAPMIQVQDDPGRSFISRQHLTLLPLQEPPDLPVKAILPHGQVCTPPCRGGARGSGLANQSNLVPWPRQLVQSQ